MGLNKPKINTMKKILFIITKSEMGGAQRFLYELVTHLDAQMYVILVAAGRNGELFEKLFKKDIKTARIRNFSNIPGIKNFLAFIEIFNLLRKFRPDILYLLSSEAGFIGSLAGSFYSLLFWRENLKIIYRIGGWAFKEPHNIFIKKIYLWSEKFSSVLKDIIIVNSEFDRQLAIKNKITKPNKITTIYNGISLNEIKFFLTEEAKKFINSKILYSKFYILNSILIGTIANLYKNKGLEFLVKTMSVIKGQMSNVTLMIIGDGPERKNLEKLIKKYKLKNNVFLLGAIPDAYKYLKALDLFVLPSIKEGQPWVILEAMAAEVPIVATNIAGIPEMIENGKSGLLVEPADPAALANAIEKMLAHPSLAQECIKNASIVVKEKFNITEMMEKNEKLF
ncbi:MAG: Glycosyl transferase, group 1 [Candidatus Azambacteria bacterium GW2011_GWA2_42_9]|uniref:Glycosyl transferase, group 1 n=3 Tax=Candidatus Azamiibacteriota TaxID=1752741 RepID=A0A0G0ZCN9_9BACT|nr:MAG: Glycosyl transferase, group 1 [Candidatus Azambacteria bacterium GW2011_GWB1_42_17]KKS46467.1 MAG: Glycosyl transferase, group 1 [Candidatus Azambacteria bacterium GW2011_GWA1_42_19]KKS75927.1 MAG: Glycosyl transferase, group 1 [Candidatus Azambacteria bacterium GW2011_GWA2_42_9]KKS88698.1 MAG: Glycosyl transferase group 1 [Parcubacteria group bacterium GW2011_GWC1_43_11]